MLQTLKLVFNHIPDNGVLDSLEMVSFIVDCLGKEEQRTADEAASLCIAFLQE